MNKDMIERCKYQSIFYKHMFKVLPESRHMNALLDRCLPRQPMMKVYYTNTRWYK